MFEGGPHHLICKATNGRSIQMRIMSGSCSLISKAGVAAAALIVCVLSFVLKATHSPQLAMTEMVYILILLTPCYGMGLFLPLSWMA